MANDFTTCVSINCLFIGFCKEYNNNINRAGGCKTQDWIVRQVERHQERISKTNKKEKKNETV